MFYYGDVKCDEHETYQSLNPAIHFHLNRNDLNNNRLVTSDSLLRDHAEVNNKTNPSVVRAYRQLHWKLRFLGLHIFSIFSYDSNFFS